MSEWRVILLRPAERYLKRLPRPEQERILRALERLQENPEQARPEPLAGRPEWKLRVGGRRILFIPDRERKLFIVTTIGPRGDVYKR
ncbi:MULTISPECIES: type II toxin-antitoxin system RelE family toxin [Thermaerobacter]|uniref:Type II toxin-antitoxin system RelE/ParE family toxin n=1 Tax=Thermaerobacter composti TaxID=554949 RepID=A0ABZ0QQN0_9FIRM|nr:MULTISPECIES: type II toxin-antitoxin system RelE/ParE family toxin [Thermaerobacter]PZN07747.1 MAG: plasmid stabilization protein [Bacillota bacterium]QBS37673.1 type II toxin-antitoxin system RelE/ParE family toxin [Thermaerobacter sp. FW80]WPD19810.1 type II toxin-antitoxin system RelE/ParE family toxin [Thermaerobacter composti]